MSKLLWLLLFSIGIIISNNFIKYLFNGFNLLELIGLIFICIMMDVFVDTKTGGL